MCLMKLDISDFTDRQKMFFFKIQVSSLIKILKGKNNAIMELTEINEERSLKIRELEHSINVKNRKIKFQKNQLKYLRS